MATPKIIADFETQLSAAISVGATSFTLSSATDDDGTALPAGLYYFTLNNGNSNKEYLAGTLSGTSVTGLINVSRQGTETSGTDRAHRVGDSVIITDFNTYKKYMDEIALVSAPDGDTTTKGVFEGATLAEVRAGTASGGSGANLAVTPDVLTDMTDEDEKAALAGGGDLGTPSTSNKYPDSCLPFLGAHVPEPNIVSFILTFHNLTSSSTLFYQELILLNVLLVLLDEFSNKLPIALLTLDLFC